MIIDEENVAETQSDSSADDLLHDSSYELDDSPVDLVDEIDSDEEDELPPPEEENVAKELNVGTILGVILIGIITIVMIVMFASGGKRKKDSENVLDKAGSKSEVEFKGKDNGNTVSKEKPSDIEVPFDNNDSVEFEEEEDVDEILNSLPDNLKPPVQPPPSQAPVYSSSGGNSSDKDTRHSKSPRKIDGLKGQPSPDTNQNIISSVLNGNTSNVSGTNQRMSKEEYIAHMLEQAQSTQKMYGNTVTGNSRQSIDYQMNKEQFYENGNGDGGAGQYMSYNSLWDGSIISGALVTAINTDNPGIVIARVTENVYSSFDHSFLLIPEGSLLYATYNSSVSYGQNKVQVAWNLLIRPDGYRVTLGNMNGVSPQGASGYKGMVNNHPFETMKALGMIAIFSIIQTEVFNDLKETENEYLKNAVTDVYSEASKLGNKIIDRALDIKPTISIKPGTEIKLITNIPLELPPVKINQADKKYIRTY